MAHICEDCTTEVCGETWCQACFCEANDIGWEDVNDAYHQMMQEAADAVQAK